MESRPQHPKWLRYSVASVLFFISCCAGFLAGHRYGVNTGYQRWVQSGAELAEYPVNYDVHDLIAADPGMAQNTGGEIASLSTEIETLIDSSYDLAVVPYPPGSSIVIRTDATTHRKIVQLLAEKRDSLATAE